MKKILECIYFFLKLSIFCHIQLILFQTKILGMQEASLMGNVIGDAGQFDLWLRDFLPSLFDKSFDLVPGEVLDRSVLI